MARPTWNPTTPEEHALIDAATDAVRAIAEAEAKAWVAIAAARDGGIPMLYLSAKVGRSRATIYRHIGPDEQETTDRDES